MASVAVKKILNVPFRRQLTESSCFPACIRMVLRYYGGDVDERWLWRRGMIPPHTGTWDVTLSPVLKSLGYESVSFWNGSFDGWISTVPKETIDAYKRKYSRAVRAGLLNHRRNASLSLIMSYISRGVPVIAEVNADVFYGKKCGWTHMIVILGFSKNFLFFHDPDRDMGGKFLRVSFSRFRKSWENLSSLAGRSMFVIFPNNNQNV